MVGKASRLPTTTDALRNRRKGENDMFGLNRIRNTTKTIQAPPRSGVPSQGSSSSSAGTGLQTAGDTMVGAIAFFPVDADIVNDEINIGPTGNSPSDFSTYIRLVPEGGVDDFLKTILNASFAGQLLYLQGAENLTVEITGATSSNGGNIITDSDLFLRGTEILTLIFDPSANTGDPSVNGAWRIIDGGSGDLESTALLTLSTDQLVDGVIDFDSNLIFGENIIDTATAGVFLLRQGIYECEGQMAIQATGGQGAEMLVSWQRSTDEAFTTPISFGTIGTVFTMKSAGDFSALPHGTGIIDARTEDVYVRVLSATIAGTLVAILNGATLATIEQISGGGAGGGGGGTGGSIGDLSDVTISGVTDGEILVFNTATGQWENQGQSASSQTPWVANIDGDGFNLDFNPNATRPNPRIDNLQQLNFSLLQGGTAIPKASIFMNTGSVTPNRDNLEINIVNPLNSFFIKSNSVSVFDYIGETESGSISNTLNARVDFNLHQNDFREVSRIVFAGTDTLLLSDTPQILWDETDDIMKMDCKLDGSFEYSAGGGSFLQMKLGNVVEASQFVGGLMRNVAQINLFPKTTNQLLANGQFSLVNDDVIFFSGNDFRNISDIGTGGQSDRILSPDEATSIIATDGQLQMFVDGISRWVMNAVSLTIDRNINLGLNSINSVLNILPTSNFSDIGNSTNFFGEFFTDKISFENVANSIVGSPTGMQYNAQANTEHSFEVGGSIKMDIITDRINFRTTTFWNNNDIQGVRDLIMQGTTSRLDMNFGDIIAVDNFTMQGSNSLLNTAGGDIELVGGDIQNPRALNMQTGGGAFINMRGGNIFNVGSIDIEDDLQHESGATLGFFGQTTTGRQVVLNPASTSNNDLFVALNNLINALGTINNFGVGIIDTQN